MSELGFDRGSILFSGLKVKVKVNSSRNGLLLIR